MDPSALLSWLEQTCPQPLQIISGIAHAKKTFFGKPFTHYPEWVIDPYIHTGEDMDGVTWTTFCSPDQTYFYFINYTDQLQNLTVRVFANRIPEIWDTWTGEIKTAKVLRHDSAHDFYELDLQLPKGYGTFLVCDAKLQ